MDAKQRRQVILATVLLSALAVVVVWLLRPAAGAGPRERPVSQQAAARARAAAEGAGAPALELLDVSLDRLAAARPEPAGGDRNPFRFQPVRPPPSPSPGLPPSGPAAPASEALNVPTGPPPAPPAPPIAFKFIGVLTADGPGKVAVLSDGRGVYHGREGEIIEGRYRIVRIGEESIQMEHLDGRGRQTIRLSGS
jgi:hypothetical protein